MEEDGLFGWFLGKQFKIQSDSHPSPVGPTANCWLFTVFSLSFGVTTAVREHPCRCGGFTIFVEVYKGCFGWGEDYQYTIWDFRIKTASNTIPKMIGLGTCISGFQVWLIIFRYQFIKFQGEFSANSHEIFLKKGSLDPSYHQPTQLFRFLRFCFLAFLLPNELSCAWKNKTSKISRKG